MVMKGDHRARIFGLARKQFRVHEGMPGPRAVAGMMNHRVASSGSWASDEVTAPYPRSVVLSGIRDSDR